LEVVCFVGEECCLGGGGLILGLDKYSVPW
jgi:hypothetical protein